MSGRSREYQVFDQCLAYDGHWVCIYLRKRAVNWAHLLALEMRVISRVVSGFIA
jgi:hypothetical protein